MKKIANRIVKISDGKVLDYPGTFDEFESFEKRGQLETEEQAKENMVAQLELQLTQLWLQMVKI